MKGVVDAADCRWLVVSYSNEGLIGLEELCDLLAGTGELTVLSTGYAKYPGGKQSLHRTTRNMELALVVRRGARARPASAARTAILDLRIARLLSLSFDPERTRASFPTEGDSLVAGDEASYRLRMRYFWRFQPDQPLPRFADPRRAEAFIATLSACAVRDIGEEIRVCAALTARTEDHREKRRILREILRLLNKLAHRKYRAEFAEALSTLRAALGTEQAFSAGLDGIEEKARRRSANGNAPEEPGRFRKS